MQAGLWDPRRPFRLTTTFWVRRKWLSHCPPSVEADSAPSANAFPEEEGRLYTPGPGTRRLLAWPRACSAWRGSHAQGLTQGTGYTCGCSRGWVLVLHSGAQRHLNKAQTRGMGVAALEARLCSNLAEDTSVQGRTARHTSEWPLTGPVLPTSQIQGKPEMETTV